METPVGISGGTYLYGRLLEVDRSVATLELDNRRRMACKIGPELREKLAARLGTYVGLSGTATWRLPDWEIVAFEAEELLSYRDGASIDETLRVLAELTGDHLPSVEELLRWRHEDEEDEAN